VPSLKELLVLRYVDEGETKKIGIISAASHKWKDIATLICDDANKINKLETQYHNVPNDCLRQVFIDNFINKKPQDYPQNWNGLIELLNDVELEALANKVKHALSSTS
jgi:hypothetical protein